MAKKEKQPKEEEKEVKVTLLIKKRYSDGELGRFVQKGEKITVSKERAEKILNHKDGIAEIVQVKK